MSRPDVIIIMSDEERAAPPYEHDELQQWRRDHLGSTQWFIDHGLSFTNHYTGSLACVPSRPTLFTGHYPDVHGVTQTDGLGKMADDSRMRWLREGEVPTLGHWFRTAGYDTHYDGKWHISHADLIDPATGTSLPTNTDDGTILDANVARYLDADPLDAFGFSGWVGPEPHGAAKANAGIIRDRLIADRVVAWLSDRYTRRRAGDPDAQRPFLLVASFVNPHDIVLFPLWQRQGLPAEIGRFTVPDVPPPPTAGEDLRRKPAAHIAYRSAYPSCYGPPATISAIYRDHDQLYRNLYYQLHATVDEPIDRVRRAVTENTTGSALLIRTSDHGELLGAHGGLHQKWFQLYDESARVPFYLARVGEAPTSAQAITTPSSHVDVLPTLLAAAGIDVDRTETELRRSFSEVHPLPGVNLMPHLGGSTTDPHRAVYIMTRDNMPEGDTGASGLGRALGQTVDPSGPLRIQVAAHVASNIEAVVTVISETLLPEGANHRWKLVRTFDDPDTWTEPRRRQLAQDGIGGPIYRSERLPDQWELYDLDADPIEAINRAEDPTTQPVFTYLQAVLDRERQRCVPARHQPWPYTSSALLNTGDVKIRPPRQLLQLRLSQQRAARTRATPKPAKAARAVLRRIGLHPHDRRSTTIAHSGKRALIIGTNHDELSPRRATGVFASELTVPYYVFTDAGMIIDLASPAGGKIPMDPLSLRPVIRTAADDRYLNDARLQLNLQTSLAVGELDITDYAVIYLAGGWGAAFDFAPSTALAEQLSRAAAADIAIGGVCHGPLGLVGAHTPAGSPLVEGRRVSAVTDKQIKELRIQTTPYHPETELRRLGAHFESAERFRDPLANHWVVDGRLVTGQNQNAAPMVARILLDLAHS